MIAPHAMTARPTADHSGLCTQANAGHRPGTPLSGNRAFTLVEMIVVTALISIMLVVAIPRLDGGLFTDGSDETVRWIVANVRQLKEKSIVDQKTYLLNVSPDVRRLWITDDGMTDEDTDAAREEGFRLPRGGDHRPRRLFTNRTPHRRDHPHRLLSQRLFGQGRHPHENQ